MECTGSNKSPKVGVKKNAFIELIDLWKRDVNWESHTDKGRIICIWFSLSFCAILIFSCTWMSILSIISLVWSTTKLKHVKVEE